MFDWLNPYMNYVKLAILSAVVIIMSVLFARMEYYKSEYKTVKANNEVLSGVNEKNQQTIAELRTNGAKDIQRYQTALIEKDKTIAKLTQLIAIAEGGASHETTTVFNGDSILVALNSMYPKSGNAGGVCKSNSAASASRDSEFAGQFLYCLTRQDALNLLINKTKHDGNEAIMREYLNSFQTTTGGVK